MTLRVAILWATVAVSSASLPAQQPRIDADRVALIGSADGNEPYLFNRISGAVRLTSGVVVVANQGSSELRWFSADGTWIRTRGGLGGGPGEFRGLRRILRLPGDSILAEDGIAARMTLFDSAGTLIRSWNIAEAAASFAPPPLGRLPDGSFVAMAERTLAPPPGYARFEVTAVRYRDGRILDTLAVHPGGDWYTVACGTPSSPGVCGIGVPYGLRSLAATAGQYVFIGNGERYEVLRIDTRSRSVDTLRRDVPPTPLSAARRAFYVDSVASSVPEPRRAVIRQRFADAPVRPSMPYFDAMLTDDRGHVWLARPQERSSGTREWDVLASDGRFVRTVSLPAGLAVTTIANGFVVGVSRDEDGVEFVAVYRLR